MADTNTYESKQKIEKWTTQEKFDALDKTDILIGTEYNIVGDIEAQDLGQSVYNAFAAKNGDSSQQFSVAAPTTGNAAVNRDYLESNSTLLAGGTAIPEDADLNDYKTAGTYTATPQVAIDIANTPVKVNYFRLFVTTNTGTDTVSQIFFTGTEYYVREYAAGWFDWVKIATSADSPNSEPVVVEVGADNVVNSADYDKLAASDGAIISYQQRLYRKSTVANGFDELQFENLVNLRQTAYAFVTNCQVLESDDDTGTITLTSADGLEVGLNIAFANSSGSIIAGTSNRTIKSIDKTTLKMTVTGATLDSEGLPSGSWLLVSFDSTTRNITTASVTSDDVTNGTISVTDSNVLNVAKNQMGKSLYIDFRRANGTKISGLTGRKVLTVNKSTNKITIDGEALTTSSLPSGSFITLSDSVSSKNFQIRVLRVYKTQPGATNYTVADLLLPVAGEAVKITVPAGASSGTITDSQLSTLQASNENYIEMVNDKELYRLNDPGHVEGFLTYSHVGIENGKTTIKTLTITVSAKSFVIVTTVVPTESGGKLYRHLITVSSSIDQMSGELIVISSSNSKMTAYDKIQYYQFVGGNVQINSDSGIKTYSVYGISQNDGLNTCEISYIGSDNAAAVINADRITADIVTEL